MLHNSYMYYEQQYIRNFLFYNHKQKHTKAVEDQNLKYLPL